MRALAHIAMRGRVQAIMSVTVLSILSLLIAPLSILSAAVVALVTLHHGTKEGMLVVVSSWFASSVLSYFLFSDVLVGSGFALVLWAPIWLLAVLLRSSRSLALVVQVALLLAFVAVGYFYLSFADPVEHWMKMLREPMQMLLQNSEVKVDTPEFEKLLQSVAQWMTAVLTAGFFLQLVMALFIARWWQAVLYNPGGFGEEYRAMQYPQWLALLAAPLLIWFMLGEPPEWLGAIATLLIAAYFLQGLAVAHALLKHLNAHVVWITGVYVLLLLALPYVMTALAMTGFTDAWMNFRKNVQSSANDD